jgi:surfactin synthase thioesterase subunit
LSKPTILFFGGAGSNYANMTRPLFKNMNFGGWMMPGRGHRSQESHPSNIRKLAQEIASTIVDMKLRRPILAGYSNGGLIAYIVCQELERNNFQVGRVVQVVSPAPLEWRLLSAYALIRGGFDTSTRKALQQLEDSGMWPPTPIPDPLLLSEARERTLVDSRLTLQYVPHRRVATPITDVSASDDQLLKFNNPLRWKRYTTGEFESIVVTGGHYFSQNAPKKLFRILSNAADYAYNSY